MSYFQQSKWQLWIFIGLVILNLTCLGFIWLKQSPNETTSTRLHENRRKQADEFLLTQLGFDDQQRQQFQELTQQHLQKVKSIQEKLVLAKKDFFNLLSQTSLDSAKVSELSQDIADSQVLLEKERLYHFKSIRTICTTDQQKKFDHIIVEVFKMANPHPKNNNRP